MDITQLTGFIGDSTSFQIPLTWAGTAFSPGETWAIIFTAKHRASDADDAAVFQKASNAGITLSGASTAVIATVPSDTATLQACTLHCDIQAQHLTTGEVRTVGYARLALSRDITRETTISLPIYTTEEYVARGETGPSGADRTVKSSSFTAANGTSYAVTASATVTDPSPVEGKGYNVLVVAGTTTIGGIDYSTAGTVIERVYHSGTWRSSKYTDSASISATDISDSSATGRTVLTGTATQARAAISAAQAIETKTANFTASIGGRYIVETGGTVSITDPTGTTAGDSYEVWVGSGSIQFNATGTSYTASRFSIRRRYTGSAWATPAPMLSDTLTVGSGTWSGSTITGAQTVSGQLQLTGQSATDSNSAMTRGLSDARYGSIIVMRLASDFDITSAILADVTGMSLSLEANTNYEVTGLLYVSAAGTSSRVQHQFAYSGTFQTMPGAIASNSTSGTYFFGGPTSHGFADANNTTAPFQMAGIIRTSNAGTLKVQNYRISGSGTPKLLAGSQIVLRKIP